MKKDEKNDVPEWVREASDEERQDAANWTAQEDVT